MKKKARGPNLDGSVDTHWRFDAEWFEGFDRAMAEAGNKVTRIEAGMPRWGNGEFSVTVHAKRIMSFRNSRYVMVWKRHGFLPGNSWDLCKIHEDCLKNREMASLCNEEQRMSHPSVLPVVHAQRDAAQALRERYQVR